MHSQWPDFAGGSTTQAGRNRSLFTAFRIEGLMNYIPLKQVATQLAVTVESVKRWTRQPENPLRAVRLGKVWCTTQEWLDAFARPVEGTTTVIQEGYRSRTNFLNKWANSRTVAREAVGKEG
jgi:hypothetical protein